eukprot:jgi/Botrbrau1/12889/Bobra.0299s0009.1
MGRSCSLARAPFEKPSRSLYSITQGLQVASQVTETEISRDVRHQDAPLRDQENLDRLPATGPPAVQTDQAQDRTPEVAAGKRVFLIRDTRSDPPMSSRLEGFCYSIASIAWLSSAARLGLEPYVVLAVLLHALSAAVALGWTEAYNKWRNVILLSVKIGNAVLGNINVSDWQGSASSSWTTFVLGDLLIYSKVMGQTLLCLGLRLPMAYDVLAQYFLVFFSIAQNKHACVGLLNRTPSSLTKYLQLSDGLHRALRFLEGAVGEINGLRFPETTAACVCPCIQAFLQLTAGLLLPLSIRYVLEPPHQGFDIAQPGVWAMTQTMAVVLVGTSFIGIVLVWPIVNIVACSSA